MPLTKYQVKERLGHGAVSQIAEVTGKSKSHVSRVLNEKRSDPEVAKVVARRLRTKLSELPERYYREPLAAEVAA